MSETIQQPVEPVVPQGASVQAPAATPEPQAPVATAQPQPVAQVESDRTREQFEKLLDNNKKLFEANEHLRQELSQRAMANQQFAPIQQPPVQNQPQSQGVNPQDFIEQDPTTGERFINEGKLQARIEELNSKATRAEQAIQQYIQTSEQREIERQNREAFNAFPDLDPGAPQFNVVFHNQTRAVIYDSLINPQDYSGKPLSFREAAEFVRKAQGGMSQQPTTAPVTPAPVQTTVQDDAQTAQTLKEQASASATGQQPAPARVPGGDSEDFRHLQVATRTGDLSALAKRIAASDHVYQADESRS